MTTTTLPTATLTACIVIVAALVAHQSRVMWLPSVSSWLSSLRRPRYRGRHVAARRLVFALPVKVGASS